MFRAGHGDRAASRRREERGRYTPLRRHGQRVVRFAGGVKIARQPAALVLLATQIDIEFRIEMRAGDVGRAARFDDGKVAALEERTEGWIAALQLAALSLQGREDVSGFIAGFSRDDRYIVDYLAEEVLARQPEDVRCFLLQTSILRRLSGPLCDAVTGQAGGILPGQIPARRGHENGKER